MSQQVFNGQDRPLTTLQNQSFLWNDAPSGFCLGGSTVRENGVKAIFAVPNRQGGNPRTVGVARTTQHQWL
jgi:hypothetical protein